MKELFSIHLNLRLNKDEERRAAEHLKNRDRNRFATYVDYIVKAVNAYAEQDRMEIPTQLNGYVEDIIERTVRANNEQIREILTAFAAGCSSGGGNRKTVDVDSGANERQEQLNADDLDWGFLNGT